MTALPRSRWRLLIAGGLVVCLASAATVYWQVNRAVSSARQELRAAGELRVTVRPVAPTLSNFEWIDSPASFTTAAIFQGELFVGGASGLYEYDERGALLKRYRPGLEIPASPLLRIATGVLKDSGRPELFAITAGAGILAFNGQDFRQIYPEDPEFRTITSVLPLGSGRLLIATRKRGVLVLDGSSLQSFHPSLAGLQVTDMAGDESNLWIGTQDQGVVHFQGGRAQSFTENDGLPDNQVFSITLFQNKTYAATAVGIAEFDGGRFVRTVAPGLFAETLFVHGSTLFAGTTNSGVTEINLDPKRLRASSSLQPASAAASPGDGHVQQIFAAGDYVYAVAGATLFRKEAQHSGWRRVLVTEGALLTDRNISSLAFDGTGHLWVGYFDRGLDLFDADLRGVTHIEDGTVFCVNRILPHPADGTVAVATANGLALFDQTGRRQQVLGRSEGLLADHVTDAALYGDGFVLATPAGLTFLDSAGPRSLYAFHGLVNNHVYTVAAAGKQVFAGTLGGISILDRESVATNYTVANRGLPHNWISAVVRTGNDWIVGTYGGGIVRLLANGHFEPFDVATAKFEVYPNAMLATEQHVLAGTLGHGLYIYNRGTNRWNVMTEGLPSSTVTALAANNGFIYVGTDNGLVRIPEQNLP